MTYYIVTIINTNTILRLSYRKKFLRLELKKGKLTSEQLSSIGRIIPPTEADVEKYQIHWRDRINYQLEVKSKSLYTQFSDAWFDFYDRYTGFPPKFTGVDGKALKAIEKYFKNICNSDAEALQTWQALLSNWQSLDDFHQKNTDLKYINSNLNKLLQNAKARNTGGKGRRYSEDFKKSILEGLQS